MLKDLKEYELKSKKQGAYPPILDRNPSFAARFLTREDADKSYKLLKEVFTHIKNGEYYYEVLQDNILKSRNNFIWFASFFRELEEINKVETFKIPYDKCPQNEGKELEVRQPFRCITRGKQRVVLKPLYTNILRQPAVNNYRIQYIANNYDMSEFQDDCYPAWYLLKNTTIFEQYNEKTNTRVRIDFRNGEFKYFIAGASDNWQPILDVPMEMDHVVSALLFRKL